MNIKAIVQFAASAALLGIAILIFACAVYLVSADAARWPLLFVGATLASALLLAYAYFNGGYRVPGCTDDHIQVSLGCLLSSEHTGTDYTSTAIVQRYKQTFSLASSTAFARPSAGYAEDRRTCPRCGAEIHLKVASAKTARRGALTVAAWVSVVFFAGWAIYLSLYFSTPIGYERQGLILPGFLGILVSLTVLGWWLKFWESSMLDRAADWTTGDHRWFGVDGRAPWSSFD